MVEECVEIFSDIADFYFLYQNFQGLYVAENLSLQENREMNSYCI